MKIAVVGAGIAGLTCAYELQKAGHDVVVFESEANVGGRMATRTKGDFPFDIGANHLIRNYEAMQKYCQEFNIAWQPMLYTKYGVLRDHAIYSVDDVLFSKLSKLRLAFVYSITKDMPNFLNLTDLAEFDTNESAYDYMVRLAGREVADYLCDAFAATFQFHRTTEMSVAALRGVLNQMKRHESGWDLHHLAGGMSSLPEALASRLTVRLNTPVVSVVAGDQITITTATGTEQYDNVVMACTANITRDIYQNPTAQQTDFLQQVRYSSTISVAFTFTGNMFKDNSSFWASYRDSKTIASYTNEMYKGLKHGDTGLTCVWLHEDYAKTLLDKPDAEIFAAVKTEFLKACPWIPNEAALTNYDLQRWYTAMPKFYPGYLKITQWFLNTAQGANKVWLCGDYLNSPWTEGALRCGQRVAAAINSSSDTSLPSIK